MSTQHDGHDVTKIHTFKEDVEQARSKKIETEKEGSVKRVQAEAVQPKKSERPVVHTPASHVDAAARPTGNRNAQSYLSSDQAEEPVVAVVTEPKEEVTPVPVPVPAAKKEPVKETPPLPKQTLKTPDTLSGEIESLSKSIKRPSILSDNEKVFETDEFDGVEAGTIIQDKKRKRFGFTKALSLLITDWFKGLRTAEKKEATTAPRKQAATDTGTSAQAKTASVPKDDFSEVVRERVRAVQSGEASKTAADYEAHTDEVKETSGWTHIIEGESQNKQLDLTAAPPISTLEPLASEELQSENSALSGGPMWHAPKTAGTRVAVSKPVSTNRTPDKPTPKKQLEPLHIEITEPIAAPVFVPPPPPPTPAPAPAPIEAAPELPVVTEVPAAPPSPAPKPPPPPPTPAPVETAAKIPTPPPVETVHTYSVDEPALPQTTPHPPTVVTEPLPGPRSPSGFRRLEIREGLKAAKNAPTNSLAVGIMIILAAMTLGVFVSIHLFSSSTTINTSINIAHPPAVIMVGEQVPIPLTNDRAELLSGIRSLLESKQETVQIYPTAISASGREEPASAATILDVLDPRIDGTFERAITEFTFGGTGVAEPFIILKATEFDAAFAGLLAWETDMSADLAPLFGQPVTKTLDPQARTADSTVNAIFTDSIIANRSGRILRDELGLERLVYVFVDQHTILITTNRAAVERLVPNIR